MNHRAGQTGELGITEAEIPVCTQRVHSEAQRGPRWPWMDTKRGTPLVSPLVGCLDFVLQTHPNPCIPTTLWFQ